MCTRVCAQYKDTDYLLYKKKNEGIFGKEKRVNLVWTVF